MALAQSNRHFRGSDGKIYRLTKRHEAIKALLTGMGPPLLLGKESGKLDKLMTGNPSPAKLHWNTMSRSLLLSNTSTRNLHGFGFSTQIDPDDDSLPPRQILPQDKHYVCPTKTKKLAFRPLNASIDRHYTSRTQRQESLRGLFRSSAQGGFPRGFALDD